MGERTRYDPGTFCWVGLATSDVAAAKAFYRSLFGWQAEELDAGAAGAYTTLRHGGEEVAILYRQQPQARAPRGPTSSAARRSSARPSMCSTPAAWLRYEIRQGRSCRSGSLVRGSARPS